MAFWHFGHNIHLGAAACAALQIAAVSLQIWELLRSYVLHYMRAEEFAVAKRAGSEERADTIWAACPGMGKLSFCAWQSLMNLPDVCNITVSTSAWSADLEVKRIYLYLR